MTISATKLSLTDLIGAALAVLIAGGGYILLIRKPLQEIGRLAIVRTLAQRAGDDLAAMRTETDRLQQEIDADSQKLARIGGGLPAARETDRYLARVMNAATANGVTIDTLSPLPASEDADHREVHVNFVGHGSFAGFHRMLRALEHELEYADVTHFSVASGSEAGGALCRLNWSLRICTTRNDPVAEVVSRAKSP